MKQHVRHPEKMKFANTPMQRKPDWIRVSAPTGPGVFRMKALVRSLDLHTVCEEAACPNIGECWERGHVTAMILGAICTRGCAFCNVATGKPQAPDPDEAERVARMCVELSLNHVVITSVDRDDLEDGGAGQFSETIRRIREASPSTTIEVLTPDFLRKPNAIETVVVAGPDVYNHNLETVPRLYRHIRPGARYFSSLYLLRRVKELNPKLFTKSGLMVGLGEERDEIVQVMDDMRAADVDFLTIGQYLQPTLKHHPVARFLAPSEFEELGHIARGKGFTMVSSTPLTRSSHHAGEDFACLKASSPADN